MFFLILGRRSARPTTAPYSQFPCHKVRAACSSRRGPELTAVVDVHGGYQVSWEGRGIPRDSFILREMLS
jgi:hypothetical protein